jgi:SAM-dependent methyltransferase
MFPTSTDGTTSFYGAPGLHADCYDALHATTIPGSSVAGDAAWFAARAAETKGPVLEGGCGSGRVSFEMARAGAEVVGFDRSASMLARAARRREREAPDVAARTTFVEADFRTFDLGRTFSLAVIPFRAFQSLLTPEDQMQALSRFHRALEPGGRLILDVFDPKYEYLVPEVIPFRSFPDLVHPERGTRVTVEIPERVPDPLAQTFREIWVFREYDSGGLLVAEEREALHMRWSFRHELRHLFARTGFEVEAEFSDFRGSPPAYGGEQIYCLRKGKGTS